MSSSNYLRPITRIELDGGSDWYWFPVKEELSSEEGPVTLSVSIQFVPYMRVLAD